MICKIFSYKKVNSTNDIAIKKIDYYFTNPIARSSKTMSDCRRAAKYLASNEVEKTN